MKRVLSALACSVVICVTQAAVLPNLALAAERGDNRSTNEGRRERHFSRTDLSTGRKATSNKSERRSEKRGRKESVGYTSNKHDRSDKSRHQSSNRRQPSNHSSHSNNHHHNDRSRQSHNSHNQHYSGHNNKKHKKRKQQHARNYRLGQHGYGHYGSKHRRSKHHGSRYNVYVGGGALLAAVTHHAYCPDYTHHHEHDEVYNYVQDDYGACFKTVYQHDRVLHTQVAYEYCY